METITLKNLEEATKEQVFDQVAKHLLQQQKKSYSKDGYTCFYRGANGLKCAAGSLIGDEEYEKRMEELSWTSLADEGLVPSKHLDLISHLQEIHDSSFVEDWERELTEVAKDFEIKSSILEN